jgi:hypothetical protein
MGTAQAAGIIPCRDAVVALGPGPRPPAGELFTVDGSVRAGLLAELTVAEELTTNARPHHPRQLQLPRARPRRVVPGPRDLVGRDLEAVDQRGAAHGVLQVRDGMGGISRS